MESKKNNYKVEIIKKNCVPLIQISNHQLLVYKNGKVMILDVDTRKTQEIYNFHISVIRKILGYFDLPSRRYGLNEIKAIKITDDEILINFHHQFYKLNIKNKKIEVVKIIDNWNGHCLYLSKTSKGIFIGEYDYNPSKHSMRVFKYDQKKNEINAIYKFKAGQINHIHNIIEDEITKRIWVFTGDFNESAAIYYTDNGFNNVYCYKSGKQCYRACIGLSINNTLYYPTDSPMHLNFFNELTSTNNKELFGVNGSCIYGNNYKNYLFFSTTVENETNELNNFSNKYKYNLGKGIKDWYVEIVKFNAIDKTSEILLRVKKDIFPMIPFKYGCFRFPYTDINDENIFCFGQAIKKYSGKLIKIKRM